MKSFFLVSILSVFVVLVGCSAKAVESSSISEDAAEVNDLKKRNKQSVLVELFTSEGCSSCPPAEAFLAEIQAEQPFADTEVITLAFHVDYWDYLGWKDKYASPLFTQRQRVYDRKFRTGKIYTPQMVVDGSYEFIGSDKKKARKAIKKTLKKSKAFVESKLEDGKLFVSISGADGAEDASIYLAFAEDNIKSDIKRGENAGRNLQHVSVVRELKGLGRLRAGKSEMKISVPLSFQEKWNKENLKLIVFVQENSSRRVLAVSSIEAS